MTAEQVRAKYGCVPMRCRDVSSVAPAGFTTIVRKEDRSRIVGFVDSERGISVLAVADNGIELWERMDHVDTDGRTVGLSFFETLKEAIA